MIKHDEYAGLAAEKHVYKQPIYAERGAILDANNEVLAHNMPVRNSRGRRDASEQARNWRSVALLSRDLKIRCGNWRKKSKGDRRYIVLKREVPEAAADALKGKLRAQNLRGIYFEHDSTRIYPERFDALSRHRIHRFRSSGHPGSGSFDGAISPRTGWLSLHRA